VRWNCGTCCDINDLQRELITQIHFEATRASEASQDGMMAANGGKNCTLKVNFQGELSMSEQA
jgi:hypothetical protein